MSIYDRLLNIDKRIIYLLIALAAGSAGANVGTAFIDGYVTGAVHGWPLYARIDVSYMGTNVATVFTDPFNEHP